MFYVLTPPHYEADRVRLYPTLAAAAAQAGEDSPVYAVAVDFDKVGRLVVPDWVIPQAPEADWTTPAELHGDGSLTAKGRIPRGLFVGRVNSPRRRASAEPDRWAWMNPKTVRDR
jgi:hypothetical protein